MKKHVMALVLLATTSLLMAQESVEARETAPLHELIEQKAQEHNVPVSLAHAVVQVESRYNPRAFNAGNYGLGQIRCGTARSLGLTGSCRQLFEPHVNLEYSMQYLRLALDKARGNWCNALTLYNKGLGARAGRSRYCSLVLAKAQD